jgi:lambda family phage tail tape measure protein
MNSTIGSLNIEVAANVARVTGDMGRIAQMMEQRTRDINKSLASIGSALQLAIGIGSIAAFKSMIESGIEAKAKLYDLSLQTGITVEQLSALGTVARYSDTQLSDVAAASNKLSKALFTTNEEGKGAAQAVKALGLNFEQFRSLAPDQQMLEVAKSLDKFQDGAGKSAAAMLLFGKQGAALLPFLTELNERSELVAVQTTASALAAKEYEDKLVDLAIAGDQWRRQTVDGLLPGLLALTDEFVSLRGKGEGVSLVAESIKTVFEALAVTSANVAFVFGGVGREIGAISAQAAALARGDFAQFSVISDAVREDGVRARAELDAFEKRLMGVNAVAKSAFVGPQITEPRKVLALAVPDDKPKPGKAARDDYGPILKQLNEKIALDQAQFDSVTKLTDAQKLQVKVFEDIDSGVVRLTLDQKLEVDSKLQSLLAIDKLNTARQVEIDALDDLIKQQQFIAELNDREAATNAILAAAGNDIVQSIRDEAAALGLSGKELRRLTELRKVDEAVQRSLAGATADQVEWLMQLGDVLRNNVSKALDDTERKQRELNDSWEFGATRALDAYAEAARNRAQQAENMVTGGLQRMEDSLINFVKTGKLSFRDLFAFMAEEYLRNQIRMASSQGIGWLQTLFSATGGTTYGALASGGTHFSDNGTLPYAPLANGLAYVPYDGFPAILHEGERVMTKQENATGNGPGAQVDARIGTVNVGQGVSMGQVQAAIGQAMARQGSQIQRARMEGRL